MVGSTITDDEKTVANRRLKIGFVLLVAVSTTLMSLRIDPTPIQLAAAFGAGIAVGTALLWFVLHNLREFRESLR